MEYVFKHIKHTFSNEEPTNRTKQNTQTNCLPAVNTNMVINPCKMYSELYSPSNLYIYEFLNQ